MAVVGIDIGATGSKCCVYSENGMLLAEAYEEYQGKSGAGIYEVEAAQDGKAPNVQYGVP